MACLGKRAASSYAANSCLSPNLEEHASGHPEIEHDSVTGRCGHVNPFTAQEVEKILWATEVYADGRRKQVKAFVLVSRYTGLRIGDCVSLRRENITDGTLYLRAAKTETGVWLPLKQEVVEALAEIESSHGFYFWSGEGTLKSGISSWHRNMATLFKLVGVKGHPHMFRHTFSVDLLSNGVPIEDVAVLLGHQNSAITSKYYNAFAKSRQ